MVSQVLFRHLYLTSCGYPSHKVTIKDDIDALISSGKAEYGKNIINEVAKQLSQNYGKGFDRTAIFRMVQFYQEFPDKEKVATLSQQLTWSHFVVLLPIEDELKRDFYAAMCKSENWSVHVLRERKNSMLYERKCERFRPHIFV